VSSRDFKELPEKDKLYEKNEARILNIIDHPFVVKVIDEIEYHGKKCFIMELEEGGSLQMLIDERKKNS
jgi:serine/threonine protein kinase